MGKVIGVFSGKGGVGKTTTVANMGSVIAHDFGKRVIAIDANTSGSSLGIHLGMHFNPLTLNNVMKGDVEVWSAISEHGSGMWVLPASIKLKDYFVDHSKLPKIIKKASKRFDIVLIDTAPTLGDETLWVMNAIDEAVMVINPDLPSVVESLKMAKCPYCSESTSIVIPEDYAPVYAFCENCSKKFIVERLADRIQVLTIEEAPCCSDPDCREIEMGGSDEQ